MAYLNYRQVISKIWDSVAVAIKTRLVDTAGNAIEKAEDAAHTSGDKGYMLLAVRQNTATALAADGDYIPIIVDTNGRLHVLDQNSAAMAASLALLDNAIPSGNELQVDVVAALPAGTNLLGQVGVDQTTPGTTNRVDAQLSGLSQFPFDLFGWTNSTYIATQLLTADGIQLSDEKTVAAGAAETQVFSATISPPKTGTLVAVRLGFTAQFKSDGTTQAKSRKWKARNVAGTWVDLMAVVSENLTTSYVISSRGGLFYAVTNFNQVPFEIGLWVTPSAAENISAQVISSSQGVVVYKPT